MLYEILDDCIRDRLERRVREALSFGWEPQGGLSIALNGDSLHFAQAMVKREDEPVFFNPAAD